MNIIKSTWYLGWLPGERTTVDFGDSATATEPGGILKVGTKFKSWTQTKAAIDPFQRKMCCHFYVRDCRTLTQAQKFSPKLVNKVPDDLKYTFVTFSCIHGGRPFKSRPKDGSRPLQMWAIVMLCELHQLVSSLASLVTRVDFCVQNSSVKCSYYFHQTMKLPCRHIFTLRNRLDITIFDEDLPHMKMAYGSLQNYS